MIATPEQRAFWNHSSATRLGNGLILVRDRASQLEACVNYTLEYQHGSLSRHSAERIAAAAFIADAIR